MIINALSTGTDPDHTPGGAGFHHPQDAGAPTVAGQGPPALPGHPHQDGTR